MTEASELLGAIEKTIGNKDITIDQRYAGEPTSKNELLRGFFYLAGTPTKTEPAGMGVARTYDLSTFSFFHLGVVCLLLFFCFI